MGRAQPLCAQRPKPAGPSFCVSLLEFGSSEADVRAAVESISRDGANAVMVVDLPETHQKGILIARLVGEAKLPAIFTNVEPC